MTAIDKNQATIDFIITYSGISTSPIFVNFIDAKDNDIQFITDDNETSLNKEFVDGSVMKRYTFSLLITRSIANFAIVTAQPSIGATLSNENIDDLADIQKFMDWINEQGESHNFPDFGKNCIIEEMRTTTDNPSIEGFNTEVNPVLCMYGIEIVIDYIDYTKVIWSEPSDIVPSI